MLREGASEPLEGGFGEAVVGGADFGRGERRVQAVVGVELVTDPGEVEEAGAAAAVAVDEGDDPGGFVAGADVVEFAVKDGDVGVEGGPGGVERGGVELAGVGEGAPEEAPVGEEFGGDGGEFGAPAQGLVEGGVPGPRGSSIRERRGSSIRTGPWRSRSSGSLYSHTRR